MLPKAVMESYVTWHCSWSPESKFSTLCSTYSEDWRNTHTHTNTILNRIKLKQIHHSLINTKTKQRPVLQDFLAKLQSHDNTVESSWQQILSWLWFILLWNSNYYWADVRVNGLCVYFLCIFYEVPTYFIVKVQTLMPQIHC